MARIVKAHCLQNGSIIKLVNLPYVRLPTKMVRLSLPLFSSHLSALTRSTLPLNLVWWRAAATVWASSAVGTSTKAINEDNELRFVLKSCPPLGLRKRTRSNSACGFNRFSRCLRLVDGGRLPKNTETPARRGPALIAKQKIRVNTNAYITLKSNMHTYRDLTFRPPRSPLPNRHPTARHQIARPPTTQAV